MSLQVQLYIGTIGIILVLPGPKLDPPEGAGDLVSRL